MSLTLLTGPMGAGKTTLSNRLAPQYDAVHHSDVGKVDTSTGKYVIPKGLEKTRAVEARLQQVLRDHQAGKRVLLDGYPASMVKEYRRLLPHVSEVLHLDPGALRAHYSVVKRSFQRGSSPVADLKYALQDRKNTAQAIRQIREAVGKDRVRRIGREYGTEKRAYVLAHLEGAPGAGKSTVMLDLQRAHPQLVTKDLDAIVHETQTRVHDRSHRGLTPEERVRVQQASPGVLSEFLAQHKDRPVLLAGSNVIANPKSRQTPLVGEIPAEAERLLLDVGPARATWRAYWRTRKPPTDGGPQRTWDWGKARKHYDWAKLTRQVAKERGYRSASAQDVRDRVGELLQRGQEKSAGLTAVVIHGNPEYVEGVDKVQADRFYAHLARKLERRGYAVSHDAGKEYTSPPKADLWVGHSRGSDRLRFAGKGTTAVAMGSPLAGSINHRKDRPARGVSPGKEHYILTRGMFAELSRRLDGKEKTAVSLEQLRVANAAMRHLVTRGARSTQLASRSTATASLAGSPKALNMTRRGHDLFASVGGDEPIPPGIYATGSLIPRLPYWREALKRAPPAPGQLGPNLEAANRTGWLHERAEVGKQLGLFDAHDAGGQHASWLAPLRDLNVAATLPPELSTASEAIRGMRATELRRLLSRHPDFAGLNIGKERVSRHAMRRIQEAEDRRRAYVVGVRHATGQRRSGSPITLDGLEDQLRGAARRHGPEQSVARALAAARAGHASEQAQRAGLAKALERIRAHGRLLEERAIT